MSAANTVGTVIVQVFPVDTEVVFTTVVTPAVVLYKVIVAVEGLLASILVQVPLTETEEPGEIGEFTTGAAVHIAATELIPEPVILIGGCALTTLCHAEATLAVASSIP